MRPSTAFALSLWLLFSSASAGGQEQPDPVDPPPAFEGTKVVWPEFADPPEGAPTARVGFVFDPVLRTREAAITVGEPVEVLLVAWDVQVALHAWELNISIDPRLTVIQRDLECDLHLDLEDGDLLAMLRPEHCKASSEIVLARYQLLLTDAEDSADLVLGIGPTAKPSRITVESDVPWPSPVYQVCRRGKDVRPFLFSEVSAVLNPEQVHPDPIEGEAARFAPAPIRSRN